ncbi:hypothetical protein GGR56DRAFT_501957 [Xylariaceae sp. FL0804]|nr:hypothetical protein GGR56DRAFT_501957 [Xylariaceae sp. FL0804]
MGKERIKTILLCHAGTAAEKITGPPNAAKSRSRREKPGQGTGFRINRSPPPSRTSLPSASLAWASPITLFGFWLGGGSPGVLATTSSVTWADAYHRIELVEKQGNSIEEFMGLKNTQVLKTAIAGYSTQKDIFREHAETRAKISPQKNNGVYVDNEQTWSRASPLLTEKASPFCNNAFSIRHRCCHQSRLGSFHEPPRLTSQAIIALMLRDVESLRKEDWEQPPENRTILGVTISGRTDSPHISKLSISSPISSEFKRSERLHVISCGGSGQRPGWGPESWSENEQGFLGADQ